MVPCNDLRAWVESATPTALVLLLCLHFLPAAQKELLVEGSALWTRGRYTMWEMLPLLTLPQSWLQCRGAKENLVQVKGWAGVLAVTSSSHSIGLGERSVCSVRPGVRGGPNTALPWGSSEDRIRW